MSSSSLHLAERSYNVFRSGTSYYARQAVRALPQQPYQPLSKSSSSPTPRTPYHRSPTPRPRRTRFKRPEDDIHRPSLGNSSFGHLISEISATKPGMEGLRVEGQTMSEEQRTFARRVVGWLMGVPVLIGTGIVGGGLWRDGRLGNWA